MTMRILFTFIISFAVLASTSAQTVSQESTSTTATHFEIRGLVRSGTTPLPGVTITATNTLTGKKVITSTDLRGNYVLQAPSRGRYVVNTEFPAFASVTKEVLLTPSAPGATADIEMVLLSRVPKSTEQNSEAQSFAGSTTGNGARSLSLSATGAQTDGMVASETPADAPALANSSDAANGSFAVAGSSGTSQDFGRDIEDIRDRIEEMRARGEFGGPGSMGGSGRDMIMIGGPGGFGGRGGRPFGRFNVNRPHGSVFYTLGNSALDAAPYSLSGAPADKPDYSSNRFGGTIGGPLPTFIDKSQKTFVFLNFAGTRSTQPYQAFSHVPTELERTGDFSQSALANGQPVQIVDPATGALSNKLSSIDPTAAALLQYIPLPNQPGQQNYRFTDSADNSGTNIGFRLMHSFASSANAGRRRGPFGRNGINFGLNYHSNTSDQFRAFPSVQGKMRSNGLNANGGYTISHGNWTNNFRVTFNRQRTDARNLYAGVTDVEGELGIAGVSPDPLDWGLPGLSFSDFSSLTDINPVERSDRTFQVSDTVIWRHGKHNIRVGADFRHLWSDLSSNTNPRGTFTFTGVATSLDGQQDTGYDFADFLLGIPQQTSIQYSPSEYSFVGNAWDVFLNDDWRVASNLTLNFGLRYEYVSPFTEANNQLVNLDAAPGFTAVVPVQPGQAGPYSGEFSDSLVKPDRNNWAPRFGFAWKTFTKTVVRGGYGINYHLGQYRTIAQELAFQPPFSFTQTNVLTPDTPLTLQAGFPVGTATVTNNYGIDPNYRLAYVQMWNLNIQRELPWNFMLNVGYIGSKGTALDIVRAPNRGPSGLRIEGVQPFLWETSQGSSILHAGNVRLRKRFTKGMAFGATYTFSKSIDNASSIGGAPTVVAQNDEDLTAERGLSSFDQRHRFTGDFSFDLPFGEGRKWLTRGGAAEHLLGNWELSGNFNISSGLPYTARVLGSYSDVAQGVNGTLRADYTGAPISVADPTVQEWFNTAAFVMPPDGQFGDAGRNTIIGPTIVGVNMALSKSFQFKDTMGMEVRLEANNVFNMVQFTSIDTVVNSPTFGQVVAVGSPRRMQIAMRYRF